MPAKKDALIGLTTTVTASRDQVVAAAQHAVGPLGSKVEISATSTKLTLIFYPGLVKSQKNRSPIGAIDLAPAGEGKVSVRVHLERWRTSQPRYLFIPVGPKSLIGKSLYVRYLRALEQELRALGGTIEHSGSWR